MKRFKYLILILSVFALGCNNINKEKLTIIDNFVLGRTSADLSKQMDSLSIQRKRFCTKLVFNEFDDIVNENNFITMNYTNTFNLSNYKHNFYENLGLLYPIQLTGTKNIMGMIVLLGHTTKPLLLGDARKFQNTLEEKYFSQNINENLIEDIKNLYISKYGQPKDTFSMASHKLYFINGNHIYESADPDRVGLDIKWETEFYTINFFTGLPSYNSTFNSSDNSYANSLYSNIQRYPMKINKLRNEVQCYSYCYIKYELNEKAIKALKLDNKSL